MLERLFKNNRAWAARQLKKDPDFFKTLQDQQHPEYFWIGCSDSRVPASEIMALPPGELFVQRNVANQVIHTDLNCLSAMQYAVDVLKVKHIIVCGHYGCGGVGAAMQGARVGLVDHWVMRIRKTIDLHRADLDKLPDDKKKHDRLCELNVIEQVCTVSETPTVQDAWQRGQELNVHGLIYGLHDGILRDLEMSVSSADAVRARYKSALANL